MKSKQHERLTMLITLGIMSAMAFILTAVFRIPMIVPFLKYDAKDIIITIGGFIYGPLASFAMSAVVSLIEMVTISETGPIGLLMNVLASCAFACTAAFVYKKNKSMKGAVIGLISGVLMMTGVMLLWNFLITPLYLNQSRSEIAAMLVPAFLPFNLIKGTINATITVLVYKPLVTALRKAGLVRNNLAAQGTENGKKGSFKINIGVMLVSVAVLATVIFLLLVIWGK